RVAADAAADALVLTGRLTCPQRLNRATLHEYRRSLKQLRDVLRLAEGGTRRRIVTQLTEVKDLIGEWHDWQTLIEVAADTVADHGRGCSLLRRMRAIGDRQYRRALTAAQRMRAQLARSEIVGAHRWPSTGLMPAIQALTS